MTGCRWLLQHCVHAMCIPDWLCSMGNPSALRVRPGRTQMHTVCTDGWFCSVHHSSAVMSNPSAVRVRPGRTHMHTVCTDGWFCSAHHSSAVMGNPVQSCATPVQCACVLDAHICTLCALMGGSAVRAALVQCACILDAQHGQPQCSARASWTHTNAHCVHR
ncbi:hypothetical protein EI94DRAFT_1698612 [Lactarius quietus]|nr:hypothetical protein EI94DRAFT_1698612 [Lactarius quietus]